MIDQFPKNQIDDDAAAMRKIIAERDEKFGIIETDIEDAIEQLYVRRSDGSVEQWMVAGYGPEKVKLWKKTPEGPMYKYVDKNELREQQPALSMEIAIEKARVVTDLGREGTEAVPVVLNMSKAPTAVSERASSEPERKKDPYDYLRDVLPPVIRPELKQDDSDYDAMIFGDTKDTPWGQQAAAQGFGQVEPKTHEELQQAYYDRFVTPENRTAALGFLAESIKATPEIADILRSFDISPVAIDAVDAIRENPDVRFEVAKVLLQKLNRLATDDNTDMGRRITENSRSNLKEDPVVASGKMSSRLYAVRMALKMIGGEFSEAHEGTDDQLRGDDGRVIRGQHRHAAVSTLMTYGG